MSENKNSVEDRIVSRLKGFTKALRDGEEISERFTSRKVVLNLQPTEYDPSLVKKTREILGMSQSIFSQFLGVSLNTVQSWEQGDNSPSDIACRFMDEIRCSPDFWRQRVIELAEPKVAN